MQGPYQARTSMNLEFLIEDDDIKRNLTRIQFKRGDLLLKQGYPSEGLYLIEQGNCQLFSKVPGSKDKIPVAARGPGEFLAEVSFIDQSKMMASAQCLSKVSVLLIPHEILNALSILNPHKAIQLLEPVTNLITKRIKNSIENLHHEKLLLPHLKSAELFKNAPLKKLPSKQAYDIIQKQKIIELPLFAQLSANHLKDIIMSLSFYKAPKHQIIFSAEENSLSSFHVLSGALQTFINAKGKTTKLTIIGPGGSAGLIHFIANCPAVTNCVVREDAFLLKINEIELHKLHKTFPLAADRIRLFLLRSIATTFNKFYMHYLQSKSIHYLF